jgi:hypothetical protein
VGAAGAGHLVDTLEVLPPQIGVDAALPGAVADVGQLGEVLRPGEHQVVPVKEEV